MDSGKGGCSGDDVGEAVGFKEEGKRVRGNEGGFGLKQGNVATF